MAVSTAQCEMPCGRKCGGSSYKSETDCAGMTPEQSRNFEGRFPLYSVVPSYIRKIEQLFFRKVEMAQAWLCAREYAAMTQDVQTGRAQADCIYS